MTLRQHMEYAIAQITALFIRTGSIQPMLHAIDVDDAHHFVILSSDNKDLMDAAIRQFIQQKDIQQLVYIAEAWVLKTHAPPEQTLPISVRNHPDRKEALIFQGENATEQLCAEVPIERDGDEVSLGTTEIWAPSLTSGRFCNWFAPTKVVH